MWTLLTWGLVPYFASHFGYNGVAYATAIIALSSLVPIIIVKRLTHFSLLKSIAPALLATLIMMLCSWLLVRFLPTSIIGLGLNIIFSSLVFTAAIFLLAGQTLLTDGRKFFFPHA